jgi:hypothetical protein
MNAEEHGNSGIGASPRSLPARRTVLRLSFRSAMCDNVVLLRAFCPEYFGPFHFPSHFSLQERRTGPCVLSSSVAAAPPWGHSCPFVVQPYLRLARRRRACSPTASCGCAARGPLRLSQSASSWAAAMSAIWNSGIGRDIIPASRFR